MDLECASICVSLAPSVRDGAEESQASLPNCNNVGSRQRDTHSSARCSGQGRREYPLVGSGSAAIARHGSNAASTLSPPRGWSSLPGCARIRIPLTPERRGNNRDVSTEQRCHAAAVPGTPGSYSRSDPREDARTPAGSDVAFPRSLNRVS